MIIDSHCHAWQRWPYQPPVPDDEHRGKIEQLLNEMEINGVDRAAVVCAGIDRNPENNAYIAEQVERFPERLVQFVDLDSFWSDTHNTPGAADRLSAMIDAWPIKGFTHYLGAEESGEWLHSADGAQLFEVATSNGLIASIACHPHQQPAIREIASRFPSVPILCHHLAGLRLGDEPPIDDLNNVLASARVPNIYIKVSGFAYCSHTGWDFPYSDTMWILRTLYEHFGPNRLCWGSDYPVVRFSMTHRQSLEVVRTHATFIPNADMNLILGETLNGLLTDS